MSNWTGNINESSRKNLKTDGFYKKGQKERCGCLLTEKCSFARSLLIRPIEKNGDQTSPIFSKFSED